MELKKAWVWGCAIALFAGSHNAHAQTANEVKSAMGAPTMESMGSLSGDLNFEQLDGDSYLTLNLGLNFDLGKIGFGIQAPVRILVIDEAPENETLGNLLRKEDWDEWTDFLKIIRFFRYGRKGETIFFQLGDLPGATLGHGTIVNHYYNNTNVNHYKMGMQLDINTEYGGIETLLNNGFVSNLIATRGYFKPYALVDKDAYMNNLAIGFSIATDFFAPYCLENTSGNCIPDQEQSPGDQKPVIDDTGSLNVSGHKAATVIGGDVEFLLLQNEVLSITPYMDLNAIVSGGVGYHAGILSVFHLPVVSIDLSTRLEYRYFTGDYIPAYFDSHYEIQKFGFPFRDTSGVFGASGTEVSNRPKRRVLEELEDKGLHGYFAEMTLDIMGLAQVGASYDDYDGLGNSNLRLYLSVPALEAFQFGAYYYRHNFEGASNAFVFDDKSMFLVEGRIPLYSFLYIVGQYWRIWQLDQETGSDAYGQYVAVDDWSIGLGFSYDF
jgi:hypothetical protein